MRKRTISLTLAAVTLVSCLSIPTASAVSAEATGVQVTVNDEVIEFPDAQPFVDENSRTLIPVRFVTEAMGAEVTWDQDSQTASISKNGITVQITIGQKNLKVTEDGKTSKVKMDMAAVAKDGRTYVPIRFVAEALGAYVDYSSLYQTVEIIMSDELTAEEIKRLRSYGVNEYFAPATNNYYVEAFDSFYGDSWFSNSHNYLFSYDKTLGYVCGDSWRDVSIPADSTVKDYALFALDYMNYQIESQRFDNSTYGFWSGNYDGDYNIDINFRTDSSLIYQPICNPTSMVAVRGIMDVKVLSTTNTENFTRIYGIENPKVGETYSIDWEFVLTTSGYGYIYDIGNFRYTDTGDVVNFINGTI